MRRIGLIGLAIAIALLSFIPAFASTEEPRGVQEMIPEDTGVVTQLHTFPSKLEEGEKTNWLAVSHLHKDVHCGTLIDDAEGDPIGLDPNSGDIYIDETTKNLIITSGALSERCKKELEIPEYTDYGGVPYYDEELDKWLYSGLRARFRDYVYGTGSDLYELEDCPQAYDPRDFPIHSVTIEAWVIGEPGKKAQAATRIWTYDRFYATDYTPIDDIEEVWITGIYLLNPYTGEEWEWQEINDLQGGVMLKKGECYWIKIWVKFWLN